MTLWMVDQLLAALNPGAGVVLASLSLATLAVAVAANGAQAVQRVSEFTLENGLQVLVIPDHRAPVVTQMVWYKVGAADEPPGSSGIAHFLEHLMFKGTDQIPSGQFSKISPRTAARTTPSPITTSPPISSVWPRTGCRSSWRWKPTAWTICVSPRKT